jgi:rhodanese-related sulfurtransferase
LAFLRCKSMETNAILAAEQVLEAHARRAGDVRARAEEAREWLEGAGLKLGPQPDWRGGNLDEELDRLQAHVEDLESQAGCPQEDCTPAVLHCQRGRRSPLCRSCLLSKRRAHACERAGPRKRRITCLS